MSGERGRNKARNVALMDLHEAAFIGLGAVGGEFVQVHAPLLDEAGLAVGCTCSTDGRCKPANWGKHPVRSWRDYRTQDWPTIEQWLREGYNVGVVAPKGSRLVGIDFDVVEVMAECFPNGLPRTVHDVVGATGKGHVFLATLDPGIVPATFEGGQVAVNGSRYLTMPLALHPLGERQWDHETDVATLDPATLTWLQASHERQGERWAEARGDRPSRGARAKGVLVQTGERHDFLISAAGSERNKGKDADAILARLREFNASLLVEPLEDRELGRMANWAGKQEGGVVIDFSTGEPNDGPEPDAEPNESSAYTLREFRQQAATSVAYLVDGLVPEGAITLWFGLDKSMKSWALLDVGMALLQGRQFLGRTTGSVETFVYACQEQSDAEVMSRFETLLSHGDVEDRVRIWRHHDLRLVPRDLPRWLALLDTLPEGKVFLVIDPLRDYIGGGSEKDDDTIRVVKQVLRALLAHRPGLTLVLLHHSVKAQSYGDHRDASGSGALTAMADSLVRWSSASRNRQDDEDDDEEGEPEEGAPAVITVAAPETGRLAVRSRGTGRLAMRWEWNPLTGLFSKQGGRATQRDCERILQAHPAGLPLHAITDALYGEGASKVRKGDHYPRVDAATKLLKKVGATRVASPEPGGVEVWVL